MTRKLWVPLLAALLVAALVGPAAVTAAEPRVTTVSVMIPASAFIPTDDGTGYHHFGNFVAIKGGSGSFVAPLSFPVPVVNIRRITLYAYDSTSGGFANLSVCRSYPPDGTAICSGYIATVGASPDTQAVTTADLDARRVNTAHHGAYLWLYIEDPTIKVYGARVTYTFDV